MYTPVLAACTHTARDSSAVFVCTRILFFNTACTPAAYACVDLGRHDVRGLWPHVVVEVRYRDSLDCIGQISALESDILATMRSGSVPCLWCRYAPHTLSSGVARLTRVLCSSIPTLGIDEHMHMHMHMYTTDMSRHPVARECDDDIAALCISPCSIGQACPGQTVHIRQCTCTCC